MSFSKFVCRRGQKISARPSGSVQEGGADVASHPAAFAACLLLIRQVNVVGLSELGHVGEDDAVPLLKSATISTEFTDA
jgi:hypothetical protein